MKIVRRFFPESLVVRLGILFGLIVVLALTATISASVFGKLSIGDGDAIHLAGGLRKQAYWITVQTLRSKSTAGGQDELGQAIAEFESRLRNPQLTGSVPSDPDNPTRRAYDRVVSAWSQVLQYTVFLAVAEGPAADEEFISSMTAFMLDIDRLALFLDYDLEQRLQTLLLIQGTVLLAILVVVLVAVHLIRTRVTTPLADLLQCARRLRSGDFKARARHAGKDELGQLVESFNYMVSDLSRSYATLETKVEEKTAELARSNVSLEVLYNTIRSLAEHTPTKTTMDGIMRDIERVVGVKGGAICVREEGDQLGFSLALGAEHEQAGIRCEGENCHVCFAWDQHGGVRTTRDGERMLTIPLSEGGKSHGVMLLPLPPGAEIDEWKMKLLESIGHNIGAALTTAKRNEEQRGMALMEERSIIARELHDSLAQSLTYLKIQVTRLKSQLDGSAARPQTSEIVEELEMGLGNAYLHLRELLTTFRRRIDGRGLSVALRDTVGEFLRRTGIGIRLHDELLGVELDSSQQVHVLQVVSEALANIEHHAHARHADVWLTNEEDRIRVIVNDDGVGIKDAEPPRHHYGLMILRERAATLGGTLKVAARAEGGTRVELEFSPRGPLPAAATQMTGTGPEAAV